MLALRSCFQSDASAVPIVAVALVPLGIYDERAAVQAINVTPDFGVAT